MQSSLDRILSAVQPQNVANAVMPAPHPGMYPPHMEGHRDASGMQPQHRNGFDAAAGPAGRANAFPPLPGFAPPVSTEVPIYDHSPDHTHAASQICQLRNSSKHCRIIR
jgi:hypothetical protein